MNQLKKINKIFSETLEPTLLNNKVKLNKSAFFNYVIERNFGAFSLALAAS